MSLSLNRTAALKTALALGVIFLVGVGTYAANRWNQQRSLPSEPTTVATKEPAPVADAEKDSAESSKVEESNSPLGPPGDLPPLDSEYQIVNAHDHLYRIQDFERYLPAAKALGVSKTIFVASSNYTIMGKKGSPDEGNDVNSKEVIACAKKYPDSVIPFVTFTPATADKIALLEAYRADGARGLKLYTGHREFHDRPLDDPEMFPVYAWLEKEQFPLIWHVNLNNYSGELTSVLMRYPELRVLIPHFGVGFFDPKGKILDRLGEILDTYENVYTDTSFGTRDILVSGLEKVSMVPDVFRKFYEKYQDRILWGTDMVVTGNKEKTTAWMASVIRACREMHEKSDYTFWMAMQGSKYADKNSNNPTRHLRGLALPPDILKKIYETNAQRFLASSE